MINFIFNILFYFLAVLIPLILVVCFFILTEYLEEKKAIQLDDTSTMFRCKVKKQ